MELRTPRAQTKTGDAKPALASQEERSGGRASTKQVERVLLIRQFSEGEYGRLADARRRSFL